MERNQRRQTQENRAPLTDLDEGLIPSEDGVVAKCAGSPGRPGLRYQCSWSGSRSRGRNRGKSNRSRSKHERTYGRRTAARPFGSSSPPSRSGEVCSNTGNMTHSVCHHNLYLFQASQKGNCNIYHVLCPCRVLGPWFWETRCSSLKCAMHTGSRDSTWEGAQTLRENTQSQNYV